MKKGEKKRLARKLRNWSGIPARTICRTMKNSDILEKIKHYKATDR